MIYKAYLLCALLLSVLAGYSNDSLNVVQRADSLFIIHEVESGETVYSLAKRYHVTVENLVRQNRLKNSVLDIGQVLEIYYEKKVRGNLPILSKTTIDQHEVAFGETLYSIAKMYKISLKALKKMNSLTSDELTVGQHLIIELPRNQKIKNSLISASKEEIKIDNNLSDSIYMIKTDLEVEPEPYAYYVQNGENMEEVAIKFNTTKDQIKEYNNLSSYRVKTGQKIIFPETIVNDSTIKRISKVPDYASTAYGSKLILREVGDIKKYTEEGLVLKIDSELNTPKFLALHRTLSIGTIFEVINIMNNQNAYVRVVGRLPETGLNQKVMLRLTASVFENLGIVDQQARMKIIYYR